ncbi:MAG: AAA family ATPase [Planctomycetaceae bacterium]|nr:AAA family ATPase [Planctomycetaceae bacterium]
MYVEHFSLSKRPFSRVPSAECCVMYPGIKSCFERAGEGIDEGVGPIMIVGPSGTGKSMLLSLLENRFSGDMKVVTLNCAAIDSQQGLIQCLLFELGLPFESQNVGELRLKLIDHLKSQDQCATGLLLMVDEAHNLPIEVLEELRMITNIVCGSQHQIRLVIAGGRPLEEKLAHPKLDSFNQRLGVRCYLQNMTRTESMFFILAQLQRCGRDGREIFEPSALEKIFDITDGVPRLVSQLSDHTLKVAGQKELQQIDAVLVREAWADLQQLPPSPEASSFENTTEGIIEFGNLDDNPATEAIGDWEEQSSDSLVSPTQGNQAGANADQTLGVLMDHLESIDSANPHSHDAKTHSHDANIVETGATLPPSQEGACNESPETLKSMELSGQCELGTTGMTFDAAVTEPLPMREILSAKARFDTALPDVPTTDTELNQGAFDSPPSLDQAATEAVPLREMSWLTSTEPQETATGQQTSENPFPLNASTLPGNRDEFAALSDAIQAPKVSDSENTLATQEAADELFGDTFEEENVVDLQTTLLAEQNRISSSMSTKELAELKKVVEDMRAVDSTEPVIDEIDLATASEQIIQKIEAVAPHVEAEKLTPEEAAADLDITQTQPLPRFSFGEEVDSNEDSTQGDDSDMLVCEPNKIVPSENQNTENGPATSQGQVVRMNYEDLFQQLRNNNNPNQNT